MAVSETEVRRMWDLDSIGIGPEEPEDDKMLDNFNKEIKCNGERYTVKLPWKDTSCKETLMNNKTQALSRLNSLSKKLNKNPDMEARYDAILEDLQEENKDRGRVNQTTFMLMTGSLGLTDSNSRTVEELNNNLYVDDWLTGADTEQGPWKS
ncbi:hypothetical protein RRG08_063170 [Elysia crispata]|uniref:Uncharacterized protein n=1 Tax=Elysia crispata TaxID=231223 RepID=A0AAE1DWR2_9GAST|nr:hypothetical protein RRG08_063170 [Elysia crispata]